MRIELTAENERWVRREVASGRFATPEQAVAYALEKARLVTLRAEIEEALADPRRLTLDDLRAAVRDELDTLDRD